MPFLHEFVLEAAPFPSLIFSTPRVLFDYFARVYFRLHRRSLEARSRGFNPTREAKRFMEEMRNGWRL
jgi:hypothetical protein